MTDQTSADDVARERATQYVQKACQWLPPMTGEQQDRLLNEIAAALQAERARVIEECVNACLAIERVECGEHEGHGRTAMNAACVAAIRALASAGTAGDAGRDKP